jgi:hypothetical protein
MAAESMISRVSRSLVAMGAFGAAGYVKRHPDRVRERLAALRKTLAERGDPRVKNVDRIVRMLDRDPQAVIRAAGAEAD